MSDKIAFAIMIAEVRHKCNAHQICDKRQKRDKRPSDARALQPVEKVQYSWAFSHLYGTISMGDERCLNEENWTVES